MKSSLLTLVDIANGLPVAMCDAFSLGQNEGSQGESARTAALVALLTNPATVAIGDLIKQAIEAQSNILVDKLSERLLTDTLGRPASAKQLAATNISARIQFTAGVTRVSISANGADIRYLLGDATVAALATSHIIRDGERLDIKVNSGEYIAVIRNASTNGTLEISELT